MKAGTYGGTIRNQQYVPAPAYSELLVRPKWYGQSVNPPGPEFPIRLYVYGWKPTVNPMGFPDDWGVLYESKESAHKLRNVVFMGGNIPIGAECPRQSTEVVDPKLSEAIHDAIRHAVPGGRTEGPNWLLISYLVFFVAFTVFYLIVNLTRP